MMAVKPPESGFAQKALIVLLGVTSTGLLTFFVWLGAAVIDIQGRVVAIEINVKSLLETRTVKAAEDTARNTRRVEDLEKQVEETKP